jgi:hypothetical protein
MLLGVGYPVRNVDAAATLPTNPHPLVEFVKINMTGEHEQTCCYEFFAAPVLAGDVPAMVPAHSVRMSSRPCATFRR